MSDGKSELERLLGAAKAPATLRAYEADFRDFSTWAAALGEAALPASADLVARYLAARSATLKVATLERRLAGIAHAHHTAGYSFDLRAPVLVGAIAGLRRTLGTAPEAKRPLRADELQVVLAHLPNDLAGLRDKAVLALGFAGILRASDLARLDRADLHPTSEGLVLVLRRSKTDQEGRSHLRGIAFGSHEVSCPVRAVKTWLVRARLDDGPLFRPIDQKGRMAEARLSAIAISQIVKRRVAEIARAGHLDVTPREAIDLVAATSAHSLRSGAITTAAANGATEWEIMRHSGHRRAETVRRYIRLGSVFDSNLTRRLDL